MYLTWFVDSICQNKLISRIRQGMQTLGEHGMGTSIKPSHEFEKEVASISKREAALQVLT